MPIGYILVECAHPAIIRMTPRTIDLSFSAIDSAFRLDASSFLVWGNLHPLVRLLSPGRLQLASAGCCHGHGLHRTEEALSAFLIQRRRSCGALLLAVSRGRPRALVGRACPAKLYAFFALHVGLPGLLVQSTNLAVADGCVCLANRRRHHHGGRTLLHRPDRCGSLYLCRDRDGS